ncbi:glycosyltransferase family 2 protein [Olivibacter sp. LS-1]|uniref:glycosyltransferase family 2 protein n=1 Tax=Olivibacter sp. LS-1 TaxID=2592345 RepID=UPI001FEFC815|nr:glycosyltransferase family 2 protein [Olivibacter sp. LS-1]
MLTNQGETHLNATATMPLVSVVIPMYQAEQSIQKTLTSVVNQQYRPLEVIIVNDGSRDRSVDEVQRFITAQNTDHITFKLINQPNRGVSCARNVGMRQAKGLFIALLDADDEWLPTKLEKQIGIMRANPTIDFLGTNRNGEYWKRWLFKKFQHLTPISAHLLLYKTFFVTPTVIFKREVLDKTGYFDEQQRYAEEGNFWIRVCNEHHCVLLNESLVITGDGKPNFGFSGLSSNLKEMEKGELKNMRLGYQLGVVGFLEYVFLVFYSLIKYIRRLAIVKLRR